MESVPFEKFKIYPLAPIDIRHSFFVPYLGSSFFFHQNIKSCKKKTCALLPDGIF